MKWTQSIKVVKVLLLAVLAAGLSASLASAQEFEGKFTLPFAASWGQAVLAPGNYTITLDVGSTPRIVLLRKGAVGVGMIIDDGKTIERSGTDSSALIAVRSGGTYRIRALRLAEFGLVLNYLPPKAERQLLAQLPVLIQRIPVVAAGK